MGDYSDFCEMYGGSPNDPDFIDNWIEEYANKRDPIERYISAAEQRRLKLKFCNSEVEWSQVKEYVRIYIENNCTEHYQVNEIISRSERWHEFTEIRTLNLHGNGYTVEGISKKHFRLVCEILNIAGGQGSPLVKDDRY
jgi:hypothetical protein